MNIYNLTDTMIIYFKIKRYDNFPPQTFKFFANEIRYITKLTDKELIRSIFNKILKKKKIIKIKKKKSTFYVFDPYNIRFNKNNEFIENEKKLTVFFD